MSLTRQTVWSSFTDRQYQHQTYSRRQEEAKAVYNKEKTQYDAMKAGVVEVPVQVKEPAPIAGDKRATVS